MVRGGKIALTLAGFVFLMWGGWASAECSHRGAEIWVEKARQSFAPVFEGETLSHSFEIVNRGTSDLVVKKVTHS